MSVSQHTIAGTVLTMPVEIRKATQRAAMFSVDADAAQRMIDYSGLKVCRFRPTRAVVVLILMRYLDGDLGQYWEYGTNVMVNPPGSDATGLKALQSGVAFVHHLPVDQTFTLEAGTRIWGYPKVLADFDIREGQQFGVGVSIDGQRAIDMEFRQGVRVPTKLMSHMQEQPTYTYRDGVLRETVGKFTLTGLRCRPGGVQVRLGDHPYAKELAALDMSKRAMMSISADNVEASFGDAREIA
jgi:hypothetical protein